MIPVAIDDYLSELEHIMETVEIQRDLYHLTDQDRWHLEGVEGPEDQKGPVDEEIAKYNIGSLDYFMERWNKADDAAKDIMRQTDVEEIDKNLRRYRKIERKISENSEFLEDLYDLDKPLGKIKVEARYS